MERTNSIGQTRHWLLIDASRRGEIALTTVQPSKAPRVGRPLVYQAAELPTFTDALLRFERETGTPLNLSTAVLTIGGPSSGQAIAIARSRWTISRAGLTSVFGRPAIVINDVVANAWAALAEPPRERPIRGTRMADLSVPGRYAVVFADEGVGAAVIEVDEAGMVTVLDAEAGHLGFAPADDVDDRLTTALRRTGRVSWERVLTLSPDDPVWASVAPGLTRMERVLRQTRSMGSFLGDVTLAYNSWGGTMLAGRRIASDPASKAAFDTGFMGQRPFRRLLAETPCWQLDQQDHVMRGAATLLSRRYENENPDRIAA